MKFSVNARSEQGGTFFAIEAETTQEALSKALLQVGHEYPVVEITEWEDPQQLSQQMPPGSGYMRPSPPVLASSRVGNPRNPFFPHLPL